ncbi:MAG: ferredoxin [Alphaproteobacteria bacterium CG_4_10_14_0_2_um_filter_63_37]|nr:MAG: ferredoxin [Proteobacteria bacterium CG1_02_64_396]PJA23555.1 MAG: ferredoxin [Alphaproteobacteria bacterium CG_4_10_14_0_2_um_filter_63_37]
MKPILDWSSYRESGQGDPYADIPKTGGDFARAVAVCIHSRQCEQKGPGVMCPSFRVTADPALSTGGRVRLLKAALNGELGLLPFEDPDLARAMDLCVACKGCKRECENSVDMAQIKTEYLAQRQRSEGVSVRTRLFSSLPQLLGRYPLLRSLIAQRNRAPWLAKLGQVVLGIAANRPLPQPVAEPYRPAKVAPASDAPAVALWIDTFTAHFAPEIAAAAHKLLTAGGYRVIPVGAFASKDHQPLCCGRTHLAHGRIDRATAQAKRTIAALLPLAEQGMPILGLEPACLLAIRDDYRALGLGADGEAVSDRAILLEEFLAREQAAGRFKPTFADQRGAAPVLVHGHCHQKAVGAMKAMRRVLRMVPGLRFELIEASCCGMAGSFGLEEEHAAISMQMAEAALLPTLRAAPEAEVVANGFSCREQILVGDGRRARHVVEVLAAALVDEVSV